MSGVILHTIKARLHNTRFMLYEKDDFDWFENHWHYCLNVYGEGTAVNFHLKMKPLLSWIPSHYVVDRKNCRWHQIFQLKKLSHILLNNNAMITDSKS